MSDPPANDEGGRGPAGIWHRLGMPWRLRATRRIWRRGARPDQPLLEPKPMPDGRLDSPGPGASLARGIVPVVGWALFPSGPAIRIEVGLGARTLGNARLGVPRMDLSLQTGDPAIGLAGFELLADLTAWDGPDGEAELRVVATGRQGERHEFGATVEVAPEEPIEAYEPPPAPPRPSTSGDAIRTLVFTHQLTLGGAQIYLLELLRELTERGEIEATVVSTVDGPLREELAGLGIPSHVSSTSEAEEASGHAGRVEEMVAWAEGRGFEVAFVNTATATAILGAEVAARLGIPTVCSIHESQGPRALWRKLDPQVRAMAEGALRDAAVRLFVADSTRVLFEPWRGDGETLTIPYGIDFEPIDSVREGFDRAAARGEAGIPAGAKLVLCVGSVEPRKAQASLTQAFERIADRHPDAHLALVGANRDDAAKLLGAYIDASPHRGRIDLVPMTPEVQRWYGIADLAVCASDIESLPRSVVEAMAWELPVLATDVFGLPDVVEERRTGWLCPPSDIGALAEGLDRALGTGAGERAEMGRRGRALVERRHSLPEYGRAVGEILREVSSGGTGDGAKSLGDG